ncbi:MAG: hypothetical protein ACO3JL_03575, partial [Myxococcota bacterium]
VIQQRLRRRLLRRALLGDRFRQRDQRVLSPLPTHPGGDAAAADTPSAEARIVEVVTDVNAEAKSTPVPAAEAVPVDIGTSDESGAGDNPTHEPVAESIPDEPAPPVRPGRKKATSRTRAASRTKTEIPAAPVTNPTDEYAGAAEAPAQTSVSETAAPDDVATKPTRKRASSRKTVVSENPEEGATEPTLPRRATVRKASAAKKGRETGTLREEP